MMDRSISNRRERIERALEAQRAYIQRVPDPDNRCRAETNYLTLLEMREGFHETSASNDGRLGSH